MSKPIFIAGTLFILFAIANGCNYQTYPQRVTKHEARYLIPLDTLRQELKNDSYEWNGPCSCEDRIPVLHAARALAYWGDPAVPILIDAMKDPTIGEWSHGKETGK